MVRFEISKALTRWPSRVQNLVPLVPAVPPPVQISCAAPIMAGVEGMERIVGRDDTGEREREREREAT